MSQRLSTSTATARGGPVNPELRHHLYHDLPAPAEVISLDEILVSEDDLGLAA
jgi:hypothetical protein